MTSERADDHNPDIAIDIRLTSVEEDLLASDGAFSSRRHLDQRDVIASIAGALRELQLWTRDLSAASGTAGAHISGIDGRLRRLEAAAAADDLAIDDLRDLIEELRIVVDAALERAPDHPET